MSGELILSLFPGIGLLDQAFEAEGFCVVRGPDLLWGGDIKLFHPPAGKFDGIVGGPPCQAFSSMVYLIRAGGGEPSHGNLIPEFERVVTEAEPRWFVMENVITAPLPAVPGYQVDPSILNNRWLGGDQNRFHRFAFGFRGEARRLDFETEALESPRWEPRVLASGGRGLWAVYRSREDRKNGKKKNPRGNAHTLGRATLRYFEYAKKLQGLPAEWDLPGFLVEEKVRALGNAVPLPMGRALAKAVRQALDNPRAERRS
jgi:DNA (cytosine-5)-methyltransferase 1